MKKLAYIVVSMLFCILQLPSHAQNLSVESFVLAETDLTANTPGTMYNDQNGEICALIKVETTQKGFTFDVGVMGVSSVMEMPGEIWVYVPFGIRKISVHHPALGVLRDYPIPVHIDKGRTYIMKLTSGNVRTIVESVPTKQYLSIVLEPADAMLEINGKVQITENGGYQELLNFGTYNYRVTSPDYHELTGEVVINDPDDAHELILKLKPAFGFVSVVQNANPDIIGANVYVDNSYVGKIPLNNHRLKSGTHSIRIIKEMYEVYNDMFIVSDEENKVIAPELVPDFAEVTLQTGTGADIYVDGEYKARHRWTGRLASGSYIFETRQSGHLPYKTTCEITRGDDSKVITIEDPIPLYGSLNIKSTPMKAEIYIDGVSVGTTPKFISKQLVGEHTVTVKMEGYDAQTQIVTITEGEESSMTFNLQKSSAPQTDAAQKTTVKQSVPHTPVTYSLPQSGTKSQEPVLSKRQQKIKDYNTTYKNKGWMRSIDFSYLYSKGESEIYANGSDVISPAHKMAFSYTRSYRFSNAIALGAGLALSYDTVDWGFEEMEQQYYGIPDDLLSTLNVPIYANAKIYLLRTKFQMMLNMSCGISVYGGSIEYPINPWYDLGVGFNYRKNNTNSTYFQIGLTSSDMFRLVITDNSFDYYERLCGSGLTFKLGFSF